MALESKIQYKLYFSQNLQKEKNSVKDMNVLKVFWPEKRGKYSPTNWEKNIQEMTKIDGAPFPQFFSSRLRDFSTKHCADY